MAPTHPLKMIAFFEQCQATNKAAGVFKKIAKDKNQPKEKKMAHRSAAHSRELNYQHHCSHKYCNYHQSNWRNRVDRQSDYHHQDDQHHGCPGRNNKDSKSATSYDKKDDCKHNHSKKKRTRPCTMTSPLHQAWAIYLEEGFVLVQDLLCTIVLGLLLLEQQELR
jgi:hypothetical protein